jgi:SAM-dependent methyltransferase
MTAMLAGCPLGCNGPIEPSDIRLPEGSLRKCSVCGQLFSACTAERYQQSMREFDSETGTFVDEASSGRQKKRIGGILKNGARYLTGNPSPVSLLDVGCSSGSVLRIAREMGFDVHGVEPAPKAAATAKNLGFNVFCGLLHEAAFPDERFDMVTLFEVIEHLQHPLDLAREIHRILRPGGVWLIGTGNAASWTARAEKGKWEYFDIDRHGGHISFFTPDSMRLLARLSGFEVAHLSTRRVRLVEKHHAGPLAYQASKILRELLEIPARLLDKGHDLQFVLRKR